MTVHAKFYARLCNFIREGATGHEFIQIADGYRYRYDNGAGVYGK